MGSHLKTEAKVLLQPLTSPSGLLWDCACFYHHGTPDPMHAEPWGAASKNKKENTNSSYIIQVVTSGYIIRMLCELQSCRIVIITT